MVQECFTVEDYKHVDRRYESDDDCPELENNIHFSVTALRTLRNIRSVHSCDFDLSSFKMIRRSATKRLVAKLFEFRSFAFSEGFIKIPHHCNSSIRLGKPLHHDPAQVHNSTVLDNLHNNGMEDFDCGILGYNLPVD